MYVTVAKLRDILGASELASLATPEDRRAVSVTTLNAAIAGTPPTPTDPDYNDAVTAVASIGAALAIRSDYVDGFLGMYSPLPIPDPDVPDLIEQIVVALVRFDLAKNAPSATVTKRYDDARADLLLIQAGTLSLPLPIGTTVTTPGADADSYGPLPIYSRCSTRRFQNPDGRLP